MKIPIARNKFNRIYHDYTYIDIETLEEFEGEFISYANEI